jgi:hypothetical protein
MKIKAIKTGSILLVLNDYNQGQIVLINGYLTKPNNKRIHDGRKKYFLYETQGFKS